MKKIIYISFLVFMSINIYATDTRYISLNYGESFRVANNPIDIILRSRNNNGRDYYIEVIAKHRNGIDIMGEQIYTVDVNRIPIDKEYFEKIYDDLLRLDFNELIRANDNRGIIVDGNIVVLNFGTPQNNMRIYLRSPNLRPEEQKTTYVVAIIQELFEKAGLHGWFN